MFKAERNDIERHVKLVHNDEVRYVQTSHRLDAQDLCNLLEQVYEWGLRDSGDRTPFGLPQGLCRVEPNVVFETQPEVFADAVVVPPEEAEEDV